MAAFLLAGLCARPLWSSWLWVSTRPHPYSMPGLPSGENEGFASRVESSFSWLRICNPCWVGSHRSQELVFVLLHWHGTESDVTLFFRF